MKSFVPFVTSRGNSGRPCEFHSRRKRKKGYRHGTLCTALANRSSTPYLVSDLYFRRTALILAQCRRATVIVCVGRRRGTAVSVDERFVVPLDRETPEGRSSCRPRRPPAGRDRCRTSD